MDFASRDVVATRMKDARKAKSLDQHEIAAALGVSQPAVSAWESGEQQPKRETWRAVAAAYGFAAMEELFFESAPVEAGG